MWLQLTVLVSDSRINKKEYLVSNDGNEIMLCFRIGLDTMLLSTI